MRVHRYEISGLSFLIYLDLVGQFWALRKLFRVQSDVVYGVRSMKVQSRDQR